MKRKVLLLTLCLFFTVATAAFPADEITIKVVFVFVDQFPDSAQPLGFPKGQVLAVGALIVPSGSPITEVTAKNLDTGLVLKPTSAKIGTILPGLYKVIPMPPFDPSKHVGVWEIRAKDEKGNEAVAKTHKMDKVGQIPYVEDLKASGNPLAPTITWTAPNEKDIPQGCIVKYRVRLLKDLDNQIYRSKGISDTKHQIPEGKLKSEDLSDIYIRVECQGLDKDELEHPVPLELRSQTFRPLEEALGKQ